MKKFLFFAALCCMLATANQVSAQLIIRNNGHAEIGHDPFDPVPEGLNPEYYNWLDTVTTLKVFGNRDEYASGAHMTFGDNLLRSQYNVTLEDGFTVEKGATFAVYPSSF